MALRYLEVAVPVEVQRRVGLSDPPQPEQG